MQKNNSQADKKTSSWQYELANAFSDLTALCRFLHLSPDQLPVCRKATKNFPLRVPKSFAECMEKGNPDDPLLRQVLPVVQESTNYPGYSLDPVGDLNAVTANGVLHKYAGRVLLISTGSCAINCRYCFRRNFPYADNQISKQKQQAAIQYLQDHTDINEVILSGGDPLLLGNQRLATLMQQINPLLHIQRLRIHSRIPVVLPSRIDQDLIQVLKQSGKQLILVLHANHANEISSQVGKACQQLQQHQVTLLNQSVLLNGVNDQAEILIELSNRLFQEGVLPYYLHQLDKAIGTGHFAVANEKALAIHRKMQIQLPGYLVPKLVYEQAGAAFKRPVSLVD